MSKGQEAMEKYMQQVPPHLANLSAYLNKDLPSLPEWEQTLIQEMKDAVQKELADHFEKAAMTRQKFVSLPKDQWVEESNGLFNLTENPRKVLGYLPKPELQILDDLCKGPMTREVATRREQLTRFMDEMRASDKDREDIAAVLAMEDVLLENIEAHQAKVEYWQPLHEKKFAIISELEQREEFLEEIEEFEQKATGDKDRYKKANSLALAEENKFRSYAAKKLKELDSKAIKLCRQYEADTGFPFEIDGILYLEMIKEQKFGRTSNPSLSLAKLRPEAISTQTHNKFATGVSSSVYTEGVKGRTSMHETGQDAKIIRRKSVEGGAQIQ